ncbi:MAG: hypothetical protein KJ944_06995 [Alphaproteobacteria bacterium]|nr:hypothetical protein [Alphaproteobacteria bacterium]MBU1560027.1 hypothetical protein [Alphaproteobacteria bacterium]MBU2302329.1 hypothetical protein [Alphaproteobacteria bacterium]
MPGLPLPISIERDEHLAGALCRAAAENGRRFPSEVLALVDIETLHPASIAAGLDEAAATGLAELLGMEVASLRRATHPIADDGRCLFFDTTIRTRHREGPIRRVSPRGLLKAPYIRAMWQLKPIGFDPRTKELLLSECPVCGSTLGFTRTYGVCFCDRCSGQDDMGFVQPAVDLRDFPQPQVEIEDMAALDFVTGLIDPDDAVRRHFAPTLNPELTGLDRGEIFDLCMAIVGVLDQDPKRAVTSPAKPTTRADYDRLFTPDRLAQAGRIVLDWGTGFDMLCERARATSRERAGFYGIKAELGQVYALTADRTLTDGTRQVVRDAVLRNMATSSSGVAVRRTEHRGRADLITTQEAAKRFGIRNKLFQRLAKAPGLTHHRAEGANKGPVLFVAAEIAALAAMRADLESASSASVRLGMPIGAVAQLAEAGLVEKVTGPVLLTVVGKHQYRRSTVDALIRDIESKAGAGPRGGFHIRLSKAMYRMPAGEKPWLGLVRAILEGRLAVFPVEGRLNATLIRLAASSFEEVVAAVAGDVGTFDTAEPMVTRGEAADILGITVATVIGMIGAQLLPEHGAGICNLRREDVVRAAETYISTAEVSRLMGVGYRWVRSRLSEGSVEPVAELRENRGILYDREQVSRWLESLRKDAA